MRAALIESRKPLDQGEVPIGAVVSIDGAIIASGFNQPISTSDPTAHAEIVALRAATRAVGNYRLTGATVCVTLEPCAVHARVGALIFGALERKTGAVQSTLKLLDDPSWNHRVDVVSGVLAEDCRQIVQEFFRQRRIEQR